MEKSLNKDTEEPNQEKEEETAVQEDLSLDIDENDLKAAESKRFKHCV